MDIMKLLKTRILPAFLALMLMLALLVQPIFGSDSEYSAEPVGKLWDDFTSGEGTFIVTENSRVYVVSEAAPTGNLLQTVQLIQRELRAQFGEAYFKELVWGDAEWAATGDIVLKLDATSGTGADGYKLNVTGTTATVTAADTDGLIYGANNLIKCFRAVGGNSISGFSGNDTPDTKERTVSLDCGRKYLTAEWIKNFIRQMSWMGYNTLQLHFSDDGGFRIDLWDPEYFTSANGNDFSWLAGSAVQTWVYNGNLNDDEYDYRTDPDKNKYLTTAELVDICNVAKEYHIEIIPSFDSPAHMDYITWRYEYQANNVGITFKQNDTTHTANSSKNYCINYTGKTAYSLGADENAGPTNWPCYTTIDITDGSVAKAFVFALYEDIADFFKKYAGSTKFSIGADEVNLTSYTGSYPRKWKVDAFPGYINDLNELLNDRGYTMRMYNDFMGSSNFTLSQFDSNIEIQYWDSPFKPNSGGKASGKAASSFVSDGRTLYNCIQTHTYYVLRVAPSDSSTPYYDARNPANRQWTFYHSTEDLIYNEWVPNNVSEKGDHYEIVADIPDANLGGAYFLIWNDYPTVSTEAELWNGAPDTTGTNNGVTYYLLDRMASNIIKMWNSDINTEDNATGAVTYYDFAKVRDTFGDFPGYDSCSKDASLPAASDPVKATAADHTALEAALKNKISNDDGTYTTGSYKAYETAYDAAVTVNENHGADDARISAAISNLNSATDALVKISGLRNAINSAPTDETSYTSESWSNFQTALNAAKSVLNDANATQEEVNNALTNLNAAIAALDNAPAEDDDITEEDFVDEENILKIQKISETATVGKYVGLIIHTATDVEELTIKDQSNKVIDLAMYINSEQTLSGKNVRVWLINFAAVNGKKQYKVFAGNNEKESGTITITAK